MLIVFAFGLVPTCKKLIAGAVPTINLPEKSIPSTSTAEARREIVRHALKPKPYYSSLEDLKRKVKSLKITGWTQTVSDDNVLFEVCLCPDRAICQDDLENFRRLDNPTAADFGYNDLHISVLRDIAPAAEGNVAGRHNGQRTKWFNVSEEPLPKRSRKK